MSEFYENQGKEFLAKTNTKMKVGEPTYGKHFVGDDAERWIFPVKFTRGGKSFSVRFGQSIANGSAEPTAYDVLACLTKYDVGSFENFCSEFGCERFDDWGRENRTTKKLYNAVCREFAGVERIWGDVLESLQEIY